MCRMCTDGTVNADMQHRTTCNTDIIMSGTSCPKTTNTCTKLMQIKLMHLWKPRTKLMQIKSMHLWKPPMKAETCELATSNCCLNTKPWAILCCSSGCCLQHRIDAPTTTNTCTRLASWQHRKAACNDRFAQVSVLQVAFQCWQLASFKHMSVVKVPQLHIAGSILMLPARQVWPSTTYRLQKPYCTCTLLLGKLCGHTPNMKIGYPWNALLTKCMQCSDQPREEITNKPTQPCSKCSRRQCCSDQKKSHNTKH